MRIELDENLLESLTDRMSRRGHDVDTVIDEDLTGAEVPVVLTAARAERRLLLTMDRGFGDIRRYPPGTHAGIVVIRPVDGSIQAVLNAVDQLVDNHDLNDLTGTITIVPRRILRIRRSDDAPPPD